MGIWTASIARGEGAPGVTEKEMHYSGKDHKGFDLVLPTVMRGGRAVPFTDWSTAAQK